MGFFSNWPFSNLHNLNLDWIIEQIKNLTDLSNKIWERVKPLPGGDPSTVTAAQAFGAANYAQQTAEQAGASAKTANSAIDAHKANTSNPHQVTAEQVGAEPAFTLLAVAKGGTGGYNPETARASLNARKDFAILPVAEGGTGSSTAAGARDALGALAYTKYQTGELLTAASDTSAWFTYSVGGSQKCQIDMTHDGALQVNRKTVLVQGNAVPYIDNSSTLDADCHIDDNAFTFDVRDADSSLCSIAAWKTGTVTVNNHIVPLLGVRIQAGALYAGTAGTTLTFPTPFSGDPYVAVCCSEMANVAVTNVTATGCNIKSSVDGNIVRWIAIQP